MVANEFLQQIKEYVDMLVILGDSSTLSELTGYYSRFVSLELLNTMRDHGLQKEIDALAEKAGQSTSAKNTRRR